MTDTWEEKMSEKHKEKFREHREILRNISLEYFSERIISVQTFINGPNPEEGCPECCLFVPHPFDPTLGWSWVHKSYGPWMRPTVNEDWKRCTHLCHSSGGQDICLVSYA